MQINVLEYFELTSERMPAKTAVVDAAGTWDFGTLKRRSHDVAAEVSRRTQARNSPIALYLPKSRAAIAAILGTLHTGNVYAPLDIKAPSLRTKAILDNLQPVLILTTRELSKSLLALDIPAAKVLCVDELPEAAANPPAVWKENIDTDPAYIIHTSGSTGTPKGVVICHRGIIDYIDWARDCFKVDETAVIANQAPLIFDNSTLDLYLCFACGATLHLVPEELFLFPVRLVEYLAANAITFLFWVPSIMVTIANKDVLNKGPNLSLNKILFAGEVMPAKQLNAWRRRFPSALFANLYGPTEITVDCTYYIVDRNIGDDEPVPIGFACRNSGILILNEQNGACSPGERGELCVRGSSLALGYWNNPTQTAAAFVQNPLNAHYPELIYRTGDLVHTNERGEITFVGRKDFQVKHMGYRIELGEIEHAVMQIPGFRNACVLYHQGRKEIVLVYEAEKPFDAGAIRNQLADNLPKYMWPTAFFHVPELPRNPSGKIDRQQLLTAYGS